MRGNEFIRRIHRYATRNGIPFSWRPDLGKGSHGVLCLGDARTMLRFTYPIRLTPDRRDGGYIVRSRDIPAPSAPKRGERLVGTPITTALKAAVHVALRDSGVSKSELARRMQVDEKEARRMLDPRHPTKVPTLERALAVLGRRAEIAVR